MASENFQYEIQEPSNKRQTQAKWKPRISLSIGVLSVLYSAWEAFSSGSILTAIPALIFGIILIAVVTPAMRGTKLSVVEKKRIRFSVGLVIIVSALCFLVTMLSFLYFLHGFS